MILRARRRGRASPSSPPRLSSGPGYRHVGCGKSVSNRMLSSPTASMRLGQLVAVVLEPERRVEVAAEVLRRHLLQRGQLLGRVLGHLVVERLEDERDPADAALDRDHLEVGVPVEDAREDQVGHHPRVADEQHACRRWPAWRSRCATPTGTCRRSVMRRDAGPDVEVHGQLELGAGLPERVPRPVGQVGSAEVLRIGRHVHAAGAERRDPLGLGDAGVDVPRRHERQRQQAVARLLLDLGHAVVVDLDRQPAQRLVVDHAEVLAAETDRAREDDLRVDPALVEHLEADLRVVGARRGPCRGSTRRARCRPSSFLPSRPMTPAGAVAADRVAVEHPHERAVDRLDARHAVLDGCRARGW